LFTLFCHELLRDKKAEDLNAVFSEQGNPKIQITGKGHTQTNKQTNKKSNPNNSRYGLRQREKSEEKGRESRQPEHVRKGIQTRSEMH